LIKEGFNRFLLNRSLLHKIEFWVWKRASKQNENIFKRNKRWHFKPMISKKISLKSFEQEIRIIFKIFPNIFDQKSQKHVIWFFKEHIKNMWSSTQKFKVAIFKSVSRWFETNNKKTFKEKIRKILSLFSEFFF
jgi:hypothetical protein